MIFQPRLCGLLHMACSSQNLLDIPSTELWLLCLFPHHEIFSFPFSQMKDVMIDASCYREGRTLDSCNIRMTSSLSPFEPKSCAPSTISVLAMPWCCFCVCWASEHGVCSCMSFPVWFFSALLSFVSNAYGLSFISPLSLLSISLYIALHRFFQAQRVSSGLSMSEYISSCGNSNGRYDLIPFFYLVGLDRGHAFNLKSFQDGVFKRKTSLAITTARFEGWATSSRNMTVHLRYG